MIDAGKIIAGGSPGELKLKYLSNPIFECECSRQDEAVKILDELPWVKGTAYFGEYIHITLNADEALNADKRKTEIESILSSNGINVKRIERISPSLEDVFVNLLEKDK